ncbi:unnamed protein product, partial [Onchocerca ochengi]
EIYNEALIMIEDLCLQIANKVLNQLGMPSRNRSAAASFDLELHREQNYNIADLSSYVQSNIPKLTFEQRSIYGRIMQTVNRGVGEIFFLDAPGGIDESTMAHKKSVEALDRSLQDLRGNIRPFGNALILFAGDFRRTLTVIPRSTPADEINACLKYSALWRHGKTLKSTTNMCVELQND